MTTITTGINFFKVYQYLQAILDSHVQIFWEIAKALFKYLLSYAVTLDIKSILNFKLLSILYWQILIDYIC